jgi:hypothetical protein
MGFKLQRAHTSTSASALQILQIGKRSLAVIIRGRQEAEILILSCRSVTEGVGNENDGGLGLGGPGDVSLLPAEVVDDLAPSACRVQRRRVLKAVRARHFFLSVFALTRASSLSPLRLFLGIYTWIGSTSSNPVKLATLKTYFSSKDWSGAGA